MDGTAAGGTASWAVVVPVKRLDQAKSRLQNPRRAELALSMALDTVRAAAATPGVRCLLVVTDDNQAATSMRRLAGVDVVPDTPSAGLNPALEHGADVARRRWPGHHLAVLSADLPALRPDTLAHVLRLAAPHPRAFVADASGSGTVLLTVQPGAPLQPAFGPDSRQRHVDSGAVDLTRLLPATAMGLRRDVDTADDLNAAAGLGVGPATRALLQATADRG